MEEEEKKGAEPASKPEWVPLVKNSLKERFSMSDERLAAFCQVLLDHHAVMAGGFVLQAIMPEGVRNQMNDDLFLTGDLDIYVTIKETKSFIEKLFDPSVIKKTLKCQEVLASLYCRSFLRRNGIRGIKTFRTPHSHIDIMSIRNHRSPIDVVTHFDLTFCQVWFDGENVYATHPQHIETRNGFLQGDYVETYIMGNRFLHSRMEKYMSRGFNIEFDHMPDTSAIIDQLTTTPFSSAISVKKSYKCFPDASKEKTLQHAVRRALLNKFHLRKKVQDPDELHQFFAIPYLGWKHKSTGQNEYLRMFLPLRRRTHFNGDIEQRVIGGTIQACMLPYEGYDSDDEQDFNDYRKAPTTEWSEKDYQRDISYLYLTTFSSVEDKSDTLSDLVRTNMTLFSVYTEAANRLRWRYEDGVFKKERWEKLVEEWGKKYDTWQQVILGMLPQGEDRFGRKGPLLLLHNHDETQGITPESLREYVKKQQGNQTKCFVPECDKELTVMEQQGVMNENPFLAQANNQVNWRNAADENPLGVANNQEGGKRKGRLNPLQQTLRRFSKNDSGARFSVSLKRLKK